jgi:hypothetical protein
MWALKILIFGELLGIVCIGSFDSGRNVWQCSGEKLTVWREIDN